MTRCCFTLVAIGFGVFFVGCRGVVKMTDTDSNGVDTSVSSSSDNDTDPSFHISTDSATNIDSDTVPDTATSEDSSAEIDSTISTDTETNLDSDFDSDSDSDTQQSQDTSEDTDTVFEWDTAPVPEYDTLFVGPCEEHRYNPEVYNWNGYSWNTDEVITHTIYNYDLAQGHFINVIENVRVDFSSYTSETRQVGKVPVISSAYRYDVYNSTEELSYRATARSSDGVDLAWTYYFYDGEKRRILDIPIQIVTSTENIEIETTATEDDQGRVESVQIEGDVNLYVSASYNDNGFPLSIVVSDMDSSIVGEAVFEYKSGLYLTRFELSGQLVGNVAYNWGVYEYDDSGRVTDSRLYLGNNEFDTDNVSSTTEQILGYDENGLPTGGSIAASVNEIERDFVIECTNWDEPALTYPMNYFVSKDDYLNTLNYQFVFLPNLQDGFYSLSSFPLSPAVETAVYDYDGSGLISEVYEASKNTEGQFSSVTMTRYTNPQLAADTDSEMDSDSSTDTSQTSAVVENMLNIDFEYGQDTASPSEIIWEKTGYGEEFSGATSFNEAGQIVASSMQSDTGDYADWSSDTIKRSLEYTYDDAGRLTQSVVEFYHRSQKDWEFSNITENTTTTIFAYDSAGNLISKEIMEEKCTNSTSYEFLDCEPFNSYVNYYYDCWL